MEVLKVENDGLALEECFRIRKEVFVKEQKVPVGEELDEFDKSATHFLAYSDEHKPCGTARWRFTEKGVKLERFAVLRPFRRMGVGAVLVEAVLEDIKESINPPYIYLNAQLPAVPLYEKFGFIKSGDIFEECGIRHVRMSR